jgi:hypothetical protein
MHDSETTQKLNVESPYPLLVLKILELYASIYVVWQMLLPTPSWASSYSSPV